mgnify:CR=1 FL=1
MESLQDTVIDQIISTYPDDILLKCHQRIVEKLRHQTATIIIGIDPTMGHNWDYTINDFSKDEVNAMKLFIKFLLKLFDHIDLIYDETEMMRSLREEIVTDDMMPINSITSYKEVLIKLLNSLDTYNNFELKINYGIYVIDMILIYFKHVFNREETELLSKLLDEFIFGHGSINNVFTYQTYNIFDQIVITQDRSDPKINKYNIDKNGSSDWKDDIRCHLYQVI